jgi:hypothetical protein
MSTDEPHYLHSQNRCSTQICAHVRFGSEADKMKKRGKSQSTGRAYILIGRRQYLPF